jgi:hypothetical protein
MIDAPSTGDATADLGAALLRAVEDLPTALPPAARARVSAELVPVTSFARPRGIWSVAAAAALLLVAIGGAVAVHLESVPGPRFLLRPHAALTAAAPPPALAVTAGARR